MESEEQSFAGSEGNVCRLFAVILKVMPRSVTNHHLDEGTRLASSERTLRT